MKGPVEELGAILLQAKCAAKTIQAQRNRLMQCQLQLQPNPPGEGDAPARLSTEDVGSGILLASFLIKNGAESLGVCLEIAARSGVPPSLPQGLAALGNEELFARLLALRFPRRPVTQAHAIARVEAAVYAIYAVMLNIQRCIDHLGNIIADQAPTVTDAVATVTEPLEDIGKTGLPDTVAAVTEHLAKIGLSGPDAAATEPTQDIRRIGLPAPEPEAAATGEPLPQETSGSMDLDQARTCLDRACTFASLAVKHIDLAVTAISSCFHPNEVARISDYADIIPIV